MKKLWAILSLLFSLVSFEAYAKEDRVFTGKVISVIDGDTIQISDDRLGYLDVRFSDIDCPEKVQPFGYEAWGFTNELVSKKTVLIYMKRMDNYGRIVAEVKTLGGVSINEQLLKNGLAWWYKDYSKKTTYQELEKLAKVGGLGIWSELSPEAPWEFRKRSR